jgi:hypothetical protein
MSLHSDTLFWCHANQSLLLLLNATCLAEKHHIPTLVFVLSRLGLEPMINSMEGEHTNNYTTNGSTVVRAQTFQAIVSHLGSFTHPAIVLYWFICSFCDTGSRWSFWVEMNLCRFFNHLRIDRNFCSVHEEITSIGLYTPCNSRSGLRKGVYNLIEVISNEPNK